MEEKVRTGNYYWCSACGRGVEGVLGKPCPQCVHKGDKDRIGILKTPEQAEEEHLKLAEAIKLTRKNNTIKGMKTIDEMHEELKSDIKDNMLAEMKAELRKELLAEMKPSAQTIKQTKTKVTPSTTKKVSASGSSKS